MSKKWLYTGIDDNKGDIMNEDELSTLWIGSFRYYVGRMTYAVSSYCNLLIREWPNISSHAKVIIQKDLELEFERDDRLRKMDEKTHFLPLGHDCDRENWEKVRLLWKNNS